MNLIRNAFSAIQDRGRVEIRTVQEGDQIRISISDDGVGIPKERLARIFELGFSSTRDRVKMGTGLATAFRVVNEHDGVINIESEVGKGTTVVIQLPVRKA